MYKLYIKIKELWLKTYAANFAIKSYCDFLNIFFKKKEDYICLLLAIKNFPDWTDSFDAK